MQLDVNPPRATKSRKRLRRYFPTVPSVRERSQDLGRILGVKILPDIQIPDVPRWSILWRMVVPGWAQWYCGYHIRSFVFFSLFMACLAGGLLCAGTGLGSFFIGLMVAVHASSILDFVLNESDDATDRITTSAVTIGIILFGLYLPALWCLTSTVQFIPIANSAPPLRQGDILVVTPLIRPQVGDIVVYEIPRTEIRAPGRLYVWEGGRIDRILAGPGQKISLKEGKLLIDGMTSGFQPLDPVHFNDTIETTVGPQQWFILPSSDGATAQIPIQVPLAKICLVNQQAVQGKVLFRSFPPTRFGSIKSLPPAN